LKEYFSLSGHPVETDATGRVATADAMPVSESTWAIDATRGGGELR
jgi:hypothetical protein